MAAARTSLLNKKLNGKSLGKLAGNGIARAVGKLKQRAKANATLASYFVLDAWEGRLSNGLGENYKDSAKVFRIFKLQTSNVWKHLNLFAIICHSTIGLTSTPASFVSNLTSAACIFISITDIFLKMIYMGTKTYFSKQWQKLYVAIVILLFIEFLINVFFCKILFVLRCLRPLLLCLRERSIRRFFTVFTQIFPKFIKVCFPMVVFLAFASMFSTSWFHAILPHQFNTVGSSLFGYWMLITTGENYKSLLHSTSSNSALYTTTFFIILLVGSVFFFSMLQAVTYDVFLEYTKLQAKKERTKEYKGLLKAFSILDSEHEGVISKSTFEALLENLKPELTEFQKTLYYELASHGEDKVKAIDFLDLKNILSYQFIMNENEATNAEMLEVPFRKMWEELRSTIHKVVYNGHYMKLTNALAATDFLLLFAMHSAIGQWMSFGTYLCVSTDWLMRSIICGPKIWKVISAHEKISLMSIIVHLVLGIAFLSPNLPHKRVALKIRETFRVLRCWQLVHLNENLRWYFECFFQIFPVLLQSAGLATIIAYFFAMLAMTLFDGTVSFFENPTIALFTMLQLYFNVDTLSVIEESSAQSNQILSRIFFVSFFLSGVCLLFNLIESMIIQLYSEAMESTSQNQTKEEEKVDQKLAAQLFERVTQKHVLSKITGGSAYSTKMPKFKVTHLNQQGPISADSLRRRLAGTTKTKISIEELTKVQKYADKIEYKVDLIKMHADAISGTTGLRDFERELYYFVQNNIHSEKMAFSDGDLVVQMGVMQQKCYFVHEGVVKVKYLKQEVKTLEKGQMFGEQMILSGLQPEFDCVALGDVTVLTFDRSMILREFDSDMRSQFANKVIHSVIEFEDICKRLGSTYLAKKYTQSFPPMPVSLLESCLLQSSHKHEVTLQISPSHEDLQTYKQFSTEDSKTDLISPHCSPKHPWQNSPVVRIHSLDTSPKVAPHAYGFGLDPNDKQKTDYGPEVKEVELHPFYWSIALPTEEEKDLLLPSIGMVNDELHSQSEKGTAKHKVPLNGAALPTRTSKTSYSDEKPQKMIVILHECQTTIPEAQTDLAPMKTLLTDLQPTTNNSAVDVWKGSRRSDRNSDETIPTDLENLENIQEKSQANALKAHIVSQEPLTLSFCVSPFSPTKTKKRKRKRKRRKLRSEMAPYL